jgi:hypothetical protein
MLISMVNTALQPSNLVFEQWQEDTFFLLFVWAF